MSNYWEVSAQEYIREELTEYAKEKNLSSPQEVVDKLLPLLPKAYTGEVKGYSTAAKAWMALQMSKGSSLTYHKSADLGEIIYDTKMYALKSGTARLHLCYKQYSELDPVLPYGIRSCEDMFYYCKLPEGCTLRDKFITINVVNMDGMFAHCILPEGFTLGGSFDTSNVTNMQYMFSECKFPEGFTLGNRFDTRHVTDTRLMFTKCTLNNERLDGSPKEIVQMLGGTI